MITQNIGPTTILVCEDTAQCLIYNPTETCIDQIVAYVVSNNYTCGAIYHENFAKALLIHQQLGGKIIQDLTEAQAYESQLC